MTSKMPVFTVALLVLLALYTPGSVNGRVLCKDKLEECTPLAGDCCSGLTCKKGVADRWSCQDGDILDKRGAVCQRRGQVCRPGLNNNCCPGLNCRNRLSQPNIFKCW